MNGRELLAQLKAATWRTPDEAERLAAQAADVTAADVTRLLEFVQARVAPSEAALHKLRLLAFQRIAEKVADKSLFAAYVRALRSGDPALRSTLSQLLPKVNNVADHPALLALMRSPDVPLRQVVAQILPAVGGKTSFESLSEMVREPSFPGRSEAMEALVAMAPQHAVPALAGVLQAGTAPEKLKALEYLVEPRCHTRDPAAALGSIVGALADATEPVVAAAIAGVAQLGTEDEYFAHVGAMLDAKGLPVVKAAIDGLRSYPSPRAVAALGRKLHTGPNAIRLAALDVLESIGTSDVLSPLVEALGHQQLPVRTKAAEVLSRLSAAGRLDLGRTVIWLLRSRDTNVRRMAVELVQSVKDPDGELWPKLLGYLRDEDWWVRERVMDALAGIAGEELVRHLVGFLQDPSEIVRRFGVDALLRLRTPKSLGALVRTAQSDPDWWVRERAIEAVGAIRDLRAAPHLEDLMLKNPHLQVACLEALGEMGARSATARVAGLLDSEDGDVQMAALRCLRALNDPAPIAAVQPLLRDARAEVRALAGELLQRWGQTGPAEAEAGRTTSVLDQLLTALARADGDDLILGPGRRPLAKKAGRTTPIAATVLSPEKVKALLVPHLSGRQLADLEQAREVDFSYRVESEDLRFRVNVFQQLGGLSAVFRIIKGRLPELESLGLPPLARELAELPNGLVLVGGATGSGKSTTLAALVDYINRTARRHVVTLEDPIEVVHPRRQGIVNQRELGTHTGSFATALRSTLRQDPDVILVGEMRDLETIAFAVTAAETGHLVFGTIHTVSAAGTVDRLINAFPAAQQDHVRGMIAGCLRAVMCQYLLPRADGTGRCLALEVMVNNDAVANLIRKGKTFQLPSVIATSRELGMQLMDADLMRLVREGVVRQEDALAKAVSKKDFDAPAAAGRPPVPAPSGPRPS